MDENLTRGYCQLGSGTSKRVEIVTSSSTDTPRGRSCYHSRTLPPLDHNRVVFLSLVVCGVGFLLPYNTFVVCVDYLRFRFPAMTTAVIDVNVTYVCLAFASVAVVNNLMTETLRLRMRIVVGYVTSAASLMTVAMSVVWFGVFKMEDAYNLCLVAVAILAVGCTVQQHNFYVYTRILPRRYTQAVMMGESVAGPLASLLRVTTKLSMADDIRLNTFVFFFVVVVVLIVCCAVFLVTVQTDFVQFYVQLYMAAVKEDDEERSSSVECTTADEFQHDYESRDIYGVMVIQSPTCAPLPTATTATTTLHSGGATTTTAGHVISQDASTSGSKAVGNGILRENKRSAGGKVEKVTRKLMEVIGRDVGSWCYVCKSIWPHMFCVWLTYGVTFCLFPGILTEVVSCRLTQWTSLLLLTTFNLFDCIGKALTSFYCNWSKSRLVLCAILRLSFIPTMMTTLSPDASALMASEAWSVTLAAVIGLTNGYFGSVSLIAAPSRILDTKKPLAGRVMTLSYTLGLATGSVSAYFLHSLLIDSSDRSRVCDVTVSIGNASSSTLGFPLENSTDETFF